VIRVLSHLDVYGGWLAAVVAGLVALGWLLRHVSKVVRVTVARFKEIGRKIDTLEELAGYELNHNGGGSIKDRVAGIPVLANKVHTLELSLEEHIKTCPPPPPATSVVVTPDGTTVTTEAQQ
jgi:hypothetical protein